MLCNPKDPHSKKKAYQYFFELLEGEELFEITSKGRRSLSQNSYLHLCLSYLASQLGRTMEYVKKNYYKITVNPELYVYRIYDPVLKTYTIDLKSSKELTKEEMSLSIERLKIWAAQEAEIVLPDAEDKNAIKEVTMEVERAKQWI